ncbi:MAG: DMT family transporter [Thermodesulfobacteriota bacterium]
MSETNTRQNHNLGLGILLTVLAFLSVAIMSAFGKAATKTVSSGVLVFFQNSISLVLLTPWIVRGGIGNLKTEHFWIHFVRGVSGLLSQYFMFIALNYISLVDAVLLVNAAPLFIPLVAWVWLKHGVSGRLWFSLLIGFIGIVFIIQPGRDVVSWATSLALAAGIFSAIALVTVGRLNTTEPSTRILFYYFLISTILTVPLLITKWSTPEPIAWIYLIGIGLTMAIAQLLLILAYEQASPSRVSPFNYSVVVFSGIIGWIVWNEVPNTLSILGTILVSAGGILSVIHYHKKHKPFPLNQAPNLLAKKPVA